MLADTPVFSLSVSLFAANDNGLSLIDFGTETGVVLLSLTKQLFPCVQKKAPSRAICINAGTASGTAVRDVSVVSARFEMLESTDI